MNRTKRKTAFVVIATPPQLTPSLSGKGKETKAGWWALKATRQNHIRDDDDRLRKEMVIWNSTISHA